MSRAVRTLAAIAGTYLTLAAVAVGVAAIRAERRLNAWTETTHA